MHLSTLSEFATRRGWLFRGESVVASTGLALATILLGVMAATGWWTMDTQNALRQSERLGEVQSHAMVLAQTAEALLEANDLSALRRLVVEVAREQGFDECRVVLSDGGVLADADISKIDVPQLPDSWDALPIADDPPGEAEMIGLRLPLRVPGRGMAALLVAAPLPTPPVAALRAQSELGLIGAVGLLATLVVYRRMRARFVPVGAIREALLARANGEQNLLALRTRADDGPEARQWNDLLSELTTLQRKLLTNKVLETAGTRSETAAGLEGACDAMWQGLVLVDDKLCVRYANGAAAVFLRRQREDMAGQPLGDLVQHDDMISTLQAVVAGSMRRKSTFEYKEHAESGLVVLRFGIRPVRSSDGAAALVVIEDVTQQRLADEARNGFLAQATHEVRMPLTNIRLYADNALEAGPNDHATRAAALNVINQEARRLERIVGDMLSVAEIEAGTLKLRIGDVRLQSLFEELRADYGSQAKEKSITLDFRLPPKFPVFHGDRDKINLALHNLVGNALKYTPANGTVTVAVEADDAVLNVDVSDTGIGIREEEATLVFEKFYRSTDSRVAEITGSGLGLALARELIQLQRGNITLRSELDKGSTFKLTVPNQLEAA